MALVYGLGFPPFHGGAFRYLDTLGSDQFVAQAEPLTVLGPLYHLPDGLRDKAAQSGSWYPLAVPLNDLSLKTA